MAHSTGDCDRRSQQFTMMKAWLSCSLARLLQSVPQCFYKALCHNTTKPILNANQMHQGPGTNPMHTHQASSSNIYSFHIGHAVRMRTITQYWIFLIIIILYYTTGHPLGKIHAPTVCLQLQPLALQSLYYSITELLASSNVWKQAGCMVQNTFPSQTPEMLFSHRYTGLPDTNNPVITDNE